MSYEPLHHKYRPQTFADLVGQETIAQTLTNAIAKAKIAPAYLFTGPRGTGKTSSARILAKSLNCLESARPTPTPCGHCEACLAIAKGTALDVTEIDAASSTGVDNIREVIERAGFAPLQCRYKVYIIDECHMLSTAAFNALLKTLEEPPPKVIFILATTDPQRVLSTIISRCQRFDYRRIPLAEMVAHLQYIAESEQIEITPEAVTLVAQIANGGLRDAESLLDQLSLLPEKIVVEKVWDLVGAVPERDLLALLRAIRRDRHSLILQQCRSLLDRGREPLVVLQNLAGFYLNLLIAKTAPHAPEMVAVTETCWQELCQEAASWDTQLILWGQQKLREAETQLKQTTQPRLWLEVTLLGLLPTDNSIQPVRQPDSSSSLSPSGRQAVEPSSLAAKSQLEAIHPKSKESPSLPEKQTVIQHHPPAANQSSLPETKEETKSTTQPPTPERPPELSSQSKAIATPAPSVDEQEIWQKVIDCLQPPTTQALLRQQCHLISLSDSSAIVGISSAKLQRLHQGKVTNIEAAFAMVCQRKIKVKLEVANAARTPEVKNFNSPVVNSSVAPPSSQPSRLATVKELPTLTVDNRQRTKSEAKSIEVDEPPTVSVSTKNLTFKPVVKTASVTQLSPQPENNVNQSDRQVSRLRSSATVESEPAEDSEPTSAEEREDYAADELQQAIDNLTRSFEGELVQLDNTVKKFTNSSTEAQAPGKNINSAPIESNRPNIEDYDDEW